MKNFKNFREIVLSVIAHTYSFIQLVGTKRHCQIFTEGHDGIFKVISRKRFCTAVEFISTYHNITITE